MTLIVRYLYACHQAGCEYVDQVIDQAVPPGVFPRCKACGHTLTYVGTRWAPSKVLNLDGPT